MSPRYQTLLLLLLLLLCTAAGVVSQGADRSSALLQTKGIALPLYVSGVSKPVAVVRVASFRKEYARKGFFRIGALPVWIAEDLSIEILKPEHVANLSGNFDDVLRKLRADAAWQVRGFSVRHPSSVAPVLSAGAARPSSNGRWELSDNMRVGTLPGDTVSRRAYLTLRGANFGQLDFVVPAGAASFNIFAPNDYLSKLHHSLYENTPPCDSVAVPSAVRPIRAND
jgi:hypothetical protein